jgi:outer membrane protein TolC
MKRLGPFVSGLLCVVSAAAHADPQKLTLHAAVDLALGKNPEIFAAKESVAGAKAHVAGLRDKRLPSVKVDFVENIYRQPYKLDFGGALFTLHEQTTSFTTFQVSQPLSGFAYLSELAGGAEHDAAAAADEYDRVRLEIAYKTADAYLHVLETRATSEVAHRTIAGIDSGLARAEQLRAADTYTDIDVLRFKSAKAAAERTALHADTDRDAALATLVVQMGLHDGTEIEVSDDLPATPPPLALSLERAQTRALSVRPELAAAREKVAAATSRKRTSYAPYFPDIRAIGEWRHSTGVQPFQPDDEELLGITLSWNLWDWGVTRNAVREADHAKVRAEIGAEAMVEQVKLDVRKRWLDAKVAFDSLGASATQQQAAEEAYRLQQVRFEAGASTATDVLDAETEVARARLAAAVARYDYFIAMVALARAIGDLPGESL